MFDLVTAREVTPRIGARYPLANAAKAQPDLASRRTVAKLLLVLVLLLLLLLLLLP
ncbi:hypothetical protein ACFRMQ_04360 [Kitasatospora sp. NPDC056783]|uniref:hypothetical protein n=1 Tax=Kitasatospora sp. NPDC056783 TaxID=3345943 RepID=UPI00369DCAEC